MKIAIIGAGVSGLYAALHLHKLRSAGISEIVVFEKQLVPGGLLQSTSKQDYTWDNGYFKFVNSGYLFNLMPDLFQHLESQTKIWHNNNQYKFPWRMNELIKLQSTSSLARIALDYIYSYVRCSLVSEQSNLHNWLRYRMTDRLLKQTQLESYLYKLQGRNPDELSPVLAQHRLMHIHNSSRPKQILKTIFEKVYKPKTIKSVNTQFKCRAGVSSISEKLAELCEANGITIHYGADVEKLIRKNVNGFEIHYKGKTKSGIYEASHVISTIPLNNLVEACADQVTDRCRIYAKKLEFMDMQLAFYIINRPIIDNQQLVLYSFEKHHRWKRLAVNSLSDGKNSVLVEIPYNPKIDKPSQTLIDSVEQDLINEIGLFHQNNILSRHTTIVHNAYPVYKIGFEKLVASIIQELESDRLQIAGRQGRFFYTSTDGVIKTVLKAVNSILQSNSTT